MTPLHDHPIIVFFSGIALLIILRNDKARIVAALATFLIVVAAFAQIIGFDLKL